MERKERVRILDIPVDIVDGSNFLKYTNSLLESDKRRNYILAVNPEKIIAFRKNSLLRQICENAALLVPDGIGVVLALRWLYGIKVNRVAGADLMQNICADAAEKGYRIYVYGGHEEVNRKAVEELKKLYPGIQIVGHCNGYLTEQQMNDLITEINSSKADIVFVALGSPKQEEWIQRYLPQLNVKICQGVGGTLDTLAGKTKRAPYFIRRIGFEWLYRLLREPGRIRRQIVCPVFVSKVMVEKLGQK